MGRGPAVRGHGQGPDGRADRLAHAGGGQVDPEKVDDVDQAQGGVEGAPGAVDVELDGVVAVGIEGHELDGELAGEGVVEVAPQKDHPLVEQTVPRRSVPAVVGLRRRRRGGPRGGGHPRSPRLQASSMPTAAA